MKYLFFLSKDIVVLAKIYYNDFRDSGGDKMITASTTEIQNNFGKYLQLVQEGDEVIVLKNGKEVARLVSYEKSVSFLTDSLVGVLQGDYDERALREERMQKYENID